MAANLFQHVVKSSLFTPANFVVCALLSESAAESCESLTSYFGLKNTASCFLVYILLYLRANKYFHQTFCWCSSTRKNSILHCTGSIALGKQCISYLSSGKLLSAFPLPCVLVLLYIVFGSLHNRPHASCYYHINIIINLILLSNTFDIWHRGIYHTT